MTGIIVSSWTPDYAPLADLTWPNKMAYCERHGYDFQSDGRLYNFQTESCLPGRHPGWGKFHTAMHALPFHSWVLALDVDTLIMDQTREIAPLFRADLILTYDASGLNSGVCLIKNTPWARAFMMKFWHLGERFANHPMPEQTALAYLLHAEPRDKYEVWPQRGLNSYLYEEYPGYDYPFGEYQAGDFILHLPALSNERRMEIFKEYLPLVKT